MKNDESAISEVMALLMLVMVAVAVSAAYYTWIADLQQEVQTKGSKISETRMNSFLSEIEVVGFPEHEYYNTDSNSDGQITVNSTSDERFIQEIKVLVINKALFNLTNVKVKMVSMGNGSLEWAALHFNGTRRLLDRDLANNYQFNGDLINFTSINKTNTSMRLITDEGISFFASNSSGDINTTSLTELTDLHNPSYNIGTIDLDKNGAANVYLLINRSELPVETDLKLYITNDQGVGAYRIIKFRIQ